MKRILGTIGSALFAVLSVVTLASLMAPDATATIVHHMTPAVSTGYAWFVAHALGLGGVGAPSLALLPIRIKAYTRGELDAIANPALASQPEALIWTYFDTQSAVTALTSLTFFTTVQASPTGGNLEIAGTIAAPKYFQVWSIGFDVLSNMADVASTDQAASTLRDIQALGVGGGGALGVLQMIVSQKNYVNIPTSFLHSSGGVYGFGYGNAVTTHGVQWGTLGPNDGGYYQAGALILPPQQPFTAQITYAAAVTLSATTNTRLWLYGVLYRKVL